MLHILSPALLLHYHSLLKTWGTVPDRFSSLFSSCVVTLPILYLSSRHSKEKEIIGLNEGQFGESSLSRDTVKEGRFWPCCNTGLTHAVTQA